HPPLNAGKKASDRSFPVVHGRVGGQYRRGFRGSVAFQHAKSEFFHPYPAGVRLQLFRAGEDVAHTVEIVWMGVLGVTVEKSIGAEQDRGVDVVGYFRNDSVV